MSGMSPRERILKAMRREQPDRVPREAVFTIPVEEMFRLRTGASDYAAYFGMDRRTVEFWRPQPPTDFSRFTPPLPPDSFYDEFGNFVVPGYKYRTTDYIYPMRDLQTVAEIRDYPFPDFRQDHCHAHLDDQIKRLHQDGLAATGSLWGTFFERAWHLRSMENLFVDFYDNPELATALLDKLLELRLFMATRYAAAGVDILHIGDDVGIQKTLLLSVDLWRQWIKPRLAQVIQAARRVKPDLLVEYHTDGYVEPFIPEFIEIGINVLNPVQPESMDPADIKLKFGDRMAFSGTIGSQTTLPFGTPDEIRRVVAERIRTVGKGGGLVLIPSHMVEPDVPWENIMAFFEAAEEFGTYQ